MAKLRVQVLENGTLREGDASLLDAPGPRWIDLEAPDEASMAELTRRFNLHRLVVEDCLHQDQRPKLEEYPGYQFIVLQGFASTGSIEALEMHELHLILGKDWLISVHEKAFQSVDAVWARLAIDQEGTFGRGVDFIAYLLSDALVDRNFPLLDSFNEEVEALEDRIFTEHPTKALMQRAFQLKASLVFMRRVLSPQRDVVGLLARHGVTLVQDRTTLYFRDVYDHLMRINEQIDSARDLVGNAVDAYLSVIANRTSDISKQLTLFASIFMPLSFVVGFFGQNFPGIASSTSLFGVMLALMVAIPVSMIWYFKHRDWL
jgi:magnesium transporter